MRLCTMSNRNSWKTRFSKNNEIRESQSSSTFPATGTGRTKSTLPEITKQSMGKPKNENHKNLKVELICLGVLRLLTEFFFNQEERNSFSWLIMRRSTQILETNKQPRVNPHKK